MKRFFVSFLVIMFASFGFSQSDKKTEWAIGQVRQGKCQAYVCTIDLDESTNFENLKSDLLEKESILSVRKIEDSDKIEVKYLSFADESTLKIICLRHSSLVDIHEPSMLKFKTRLK